MAAGRGGVWLARHAVVDGGACVVGLAWLAPTQPMGVLCVLLVGAHTMVESMLEVQRGVVFILWLFAAAVVPLHDSEWNGRKSD